MVLISQLRLNHNRCPGRKIQSSEWLLRPLLCTGHWSTQRLQPRCHCTPLISAQPVGLQPTLPCPGFFFFFLYTNRDDKVGLCLQSMKDFMSYCSACSWPRVCVTAFFDCLDLLVITKGSCKIKPWGYVFRNRCLRCGPKTCTSLRRAVQTALDLVHTLPMFLGHYMFHLPRV